MIKNIKITGPQKRLGNPAIDNTRHAAFQIRAAPDKRLHVSITDSRGKNKRSV